MLEHLREAFYEVMYKYRIPFSETGVQANLEIWNREKEFLRNLLSKHPDWQEEELAIVFDVSEERGIDQGIVDEAKFELFMLAEEFILDKEQLLNFNNAINAATMDYARVPHESRLEDIRRYGAIKCAPGQKASRIINRICQQFGIDRYETDKVTENENSRQIRRIRPYNAIFARLADALNPIEIHKKAVLSIHPCDFLEMSNKNNSWSSCHNLEDGCHKGGCQSYMGDSVSMILFTVEDSVTKDFHKAIRLTREIFCYDNGLLLQSRLYPTDNEEQKKLYRQAVQKAVAVCLNVPNLWTTKRTLSDIKGYWDTAEDANHYDDYNYDYAVLSFLNNHESYGHLLIGSLAACTCCGGEQDESDRIHCTDCTATVVCKDCGKTVPQSHFHARYFEGAYYCNECIQVCASCKSLMHGVTYPAFDRFGNLTSLCIGCYEHILEPCGQCNIQSVCSLIQGERFCPYTAVTECAA